MMASASLPWGNAPITRIIDMMKRNNVTLEIGGCGAATELVEKSLVVDPGKRATAKELLEIAERIFEHNCTRNYNAVRKSPPHNQIEKNFMMSIEKSMKVRRNTKIVKPCRMLGSRRNQSHHLMSFK